MAMALLVGTSVTMGSRAMDLVPEGANSDWQIRWDNTVKYSGGLRLLKQDEALINTTSKVNADDGDRSFDQGGLMSNRLDLLSEFDAQNSGFGLRLSAAAWYDDVYNHQNDHDSEATANKRTVDYNEFTPGTRAMAGRHAEMIDWFTFGSFNLGESAMRLSYRLGQHSLIWGTGLFFGNNSVSKGMAPTDIYKLNIPGTLAKETTMPVPQLSSTLQITEDTSVEAYLQFKFRPTRLSPAGSYFSSTDFMGDGSQRMNAGGAGWLDYAGTIKDKGPHNFGVALNTRSDDWGVELGVYALRYEDPSPQVYTQVPNKRYWFVYPENISTVGFSLSKSVEETTYSMEYSWRWGQPLVAAQGTLSLAPGVTAMDLADDVSFPRGRTEHLNFQVVSALGPTSFWQGASLTGELAMQHVKQIDQNRAKVDSTRNGGAAAFRVIFSPTYYQVASGLDLTPSINLGWAMRGKSMIDNSFPFSGSPDHGGDLVLGVTALYQNTWTANVSWINYLGKPDTQPMLDRDYLRFSLQRSF